MLDYLKYSHLNLKLVDTESTTLESSPNHLLLYRSLSVRAPVPDAPRSYVDDRGFRLI